MNVTSQLLLDRLLEERDARRKAEHDRRSSDELAGECLAELRRVKARLTTVASWTDKALLEDFRNVAHEICVEVESFVARVRDPTLPF